MNIEELREFCLSLPGVTEDIKWGDNLCFCLAGKIFCLAGLDSPLRVALKIPEEQFDELTATAHISQASHFARRQWISINDEGVFSRDHWEHYIKQSYALVKEKLPGKIREALEKPEG